MGFFDGTTSISGGSHRGHGHSHSHGHHSSSGIFGLGGHHHNTSRSSFFGRPSYYKRSPRSSYLTKLYKQLKRLLRDLVYYMKRNPMKVFMLVIMPLITGGALTGLLRQFGIRLPLGVEKIFSSLGGGTSVGRGYDGELRFERSRTEYGSDMGIGSMMNVAKMFI